MGRKTLVIADIIDNLRRVFQVVNEQSKKAKSDRTNRPPTLGHQDHSRFRPDQGLGPGRQDVPSSSHGSGHTRPARIHGMVERVRSTDDRRVVKVDLTDSGHELVSKSPEVAQGLLVAGLEVLPGKELESIATGLDHLVKILGAQKLSP